MSILGNNMEKTLDWENSEMIEQNKEPPHNTFRD